MPAHNEWDCMLLSSTQLLTTLVVGLACKAQQQRQQLQRLLSADQQAVVGDEYDSTGFAVLLIGANAVASLTNVAMLAWVACHSKAVAQERLRNGSGGTVQQSAIVSRPGGDARDETKSEIDRVPPDLVSVRATTHQSATNTSDTTNSAAVKPRRLAAAAGSGPSPAAVEAAASEGKTHHKRSKVVPLSSAEAPSTSGFESSDHKTRQAQGAWRVQIASASHVGETDEMMLEDLEAGGVMPVEPSPGGSPPAARDYQAVHTAASIRIQARWSLTGNADRPNVVLCNMIVQI